MGILTFRSRTLRTVVGVRRSSILVLAGILLAIGFAVAAAATKAKVTLIGDSVADRMERNPVAIAALNGQFRLDLETRGCRRLVRPSCTIQGPSGPPPTVLQLVERLSQNIGKIVVVDVGYNDTPSHYDHDLDTVMRAVETVSAYFTGECRHPARAEGMARVRHRRLGQLQREPPGLVRARRDPPEPPRGGQARRVHQIRPRTVRILNP